MDGKGPRLLDLIPKDRFWVGKEACNEDKNGGFEEKLELRLGLPGEEEKNGESVKSVFSRGYSANVAKRVFLGSVEANKGKGIINEKTTEARNENTSMANNGSQTRNTTAPVVGWPPIRSFRKNLSNPSNSKQAQSLEIGTENKVESSKKGLFVKINMDGVPIGRKIDLKAYNGYEELSLAVDQLFKGLLAAQRDPLEASSGKSTGEDKRDLTGLVNGTGEYMLVYEDEEGDRVLVGDVPWKMFISTAKRLRVLKTSDLPFSSLSTTNRKRTATEC